MTRWGRWTAIALIALAAGCASGPKQTPEQKFAASLERGNAAFREKHYDDALSAYRKAAQAKPDDGSGYFGMYMAYTALGRKEEADAAYAKATELSPGLGGQQHPMNGEDKSMEGMGGGMGGAPSGGEPTPKVQADTVGGAQMTGEWLQRHVESMSSDSTKK